MAQAQKTTREDHGQQNALAWFSSIVEMVDALREAEKAEQDDVSDSYIDKVRDRITESVLSVQMRSDWYSQVDTLPIPPAEFNILLTTGGPAALRLIGELDQHGEPETARLEYQDWGTPWTAVRSADLEQSKEFAGKDNATGYLLDFARQFYFGEG